jgi:phenylacetate-CoA ligase
MGLLHNLLAIRRNTRRKKADLLAMQETKLKAIVRYAYDSVPFYHKLMKMHNVRPTDIRSINDLKKLPLVTKEDVQENVHNMISNTVDLSKCVKLKTSGSTGVPLTVFKDRDGLNFEHAVSLRVSLECGRGVRDRETQVRWTGSGSWQEEKQPRPKSVSEYLGLFRSKWILADQHSLEDIVNILALHKPDVLVSYPSLLQMIVERAENRIHPKLVFSTAEILGESIRASLKKSFGARVIDAYGCVEDGDIAWECPEEHGGYHINIDSLVVEFLRDGDDVASGEDGEIVLTNLFNHAMPLIRYTIGDIGSSADEECPCGRTLPLMRSVQGRCNDFVVLPDGRRLSPWFFWNMIDLTGVSEFRIVQEKRDLIKVWLKAAAEYGQHRAEKTAVSLQRAFGEEVNVIVEITDELPRDHSKKLRNVVSHVSD